LPAVFVHDLQTGRTEQLSVSSSGGLQDEPSGNQTISADGRVVAFESVATNLVPGTKAAEVYVYDRITGAIDVASRSNSGAFAAGAGSLDPEISANGRFVSFSSGARNLAPGTNGNTGWDVFRRDIGPVVGVGELARGGKPTGAGSAMFGTTNILSR